MANKKVLTYLEKLEKQSNRATDMTTAALLVTAIGGGATVVSALMGGAAAVSTDIGLTHLKSDVCVESTFKAEAIAKRNQLADDLQSGKITLEEYKTQIDNIYSEENIVDYAKRSDNKKLNTLASSIESTKHMGDTVLGKGVPTMLGITAVGAVGYSITESIRKKYDRILREARAEENTISR